MPAAPTTITTHACAKINLALSVGPPVPPKGYHPIASWFVPIALGDNLELATLPVGEPSRFVIAWADDAPKPSPIDWPIEKDLAVRAHELLQERAGRELPVAMSLRKRTPVGGGLGGGSSDAAAMLRACIALFDLKLSRDELAEMSAKLGSDIAFFLDADDSGSILEAPRSAIVTGFGERIERLPPIAAEILLLIPPFGCPTGAVYQSYDRSPRPLEERRVRLLATEAAKRKTVSSGELFNDLAAPACIVTPRLGDVYVRLRREVSVPVHVTGSGSTMFALDANASAEAAIRAAAPELVVVRTRIGP